MPETKYTPSMHHPRRRDVTTSMVGFRNGHIPKKKKKKKISPTMVNPRDIAVNAEQYHCRTQKKKGEGGGVEGRRRRR